MLPWKLAIVIHFTFLITYYCNSAESKVLQLTGRNIFSGHSVISGFKVHHRNVTFCQLYTI